jgi:hypothetical protein
MNGNAKDVLLKTLPVRGARGGDWDIAVFGAGARGKRLHAMLRACKIEAAMFLDNDASKQGTKFQGADVRKPLDAANRENLLVIVAVKNGAVQIADYLRQNGFGAVVLMREAEDALRPVMGVMIDGALDLFEYMAVYGRGTDACMDRGFLPVAVHFYQPVPDLNDLRRRDVWSKVSALRGIVWEPERYIANIRRLAAYKPAKDRAAAADGMEFSLDNNTFSYMRASVLYGMIRRNKPGRIIEIGSGNSSKVIRRAIADNNAEARGYTVRYTIIDPYCAFNESQFYDVCEVNILRVPVESCEVALFAALEENDILFIDSSHTVRTGGDVNFEILEVLPVLKKGVAAHFHDVSLPYEYPEIYAVNPEFRVFWTESYLLQAFLAFNDAYEIVLPMAFLEGEYPDELRRCYPGRPRAGQSSSFWIKRVG